MTNWPDWKDAGKRVSARLRDGRTVAGVLYVHDQFFDGENEVPVFWIQLEDKTGVSFAECASWEYSR